MKTAIFHKKFGRFGGGKHLNVKKKNNTDRWGLVLFM